MEKFILQLEVNNIIVIEKQQSERKKICLKRLFIKQNIK